MLPLIGLAVSFAPELIKLLASDHAGTIEGAIVQAVTDVTGGIDPVAAKQKLDQDPQAAAQLTQRLAEIARKAAEALKNEAGNTPAGRDQQPAADSASNVTGLLHMLTGAANYAAPAVSFVVTFGFIAILGILMFFGLPNSDQNTIGIVNLTMGVLGTAFATVVNFWLGSSSGSRSKDAAALQMQATNASQTGQLLQTLHTVQQSHLEQARTAVKALQEVATGTTGPTSPPPPPAPECFDRCVAITLTHEGGFCNNPADPGGATNFGITLATLQTARGVAVTVDDVRCMPRDEAVNIYRASYWLPARCGDMPAGVDLMVFDFAVNAGPRTAVRTVQRLVGVKDDGSVGPMTLAAIGRADRKTLINAMAQARLDFYRGLATWPTFGGGWAKRVRQVEQAALLMA